MAKYKNKHDISGRCSNEGYNAEQLFWKLVENLGGNPKWSNKEEQFAGIDFHVFSSVKVDVKSRKRKSRKDDKAQDEWIWVEFKNVQGNDGWLYGKADYIAFERENDFILVDRRELVEMCEILVNLSGNVKSANKAHYRGYQRQGRKDLIAMIKFSDIFDHTNFFILQKKI